MLSSRLEFDCLDTIDRQRYFKTPARTAKKASTHTDASASNNSTPISSRTRTSRLRLSTSSKRGRSPTSPGKTIAPPSRIMKPSGKIYKYKKELQCDRWEDDTAFCKFCDQKLRINSSGNTTSHSHLLYICLGVPGLGPIPKNINYRKRPSAIHRRLSEIAAVFDPGGHS